MTQTQSIDDVMNLINKKLVQTAKKQLISVDGSLAFWVHNGPVLKNLVDLRSAFESMGADLFTYHVNHEKNDFAYLIFKSYKRKVKITNLCPFIKKDKNISVS